MAGFNMGMMLAMRKKLAEFQGRHPKFIMFLRDASYAMQEGTVAEIKLTTPDGKEYVTNIRVTAEDMEMLEGLKNAGPMA